MGQSGFTAEASWICWADLIGKWSCGADPQHAWFVPGSLGSYTSLDSQKPAFRRTYETTAQAGPDHAIGLGLLGQDVIELTERLGLKRFVVIGHDWGARAAYILAALHPERVQGLLTLSVGYGTNDPRQKIAYAQA